MSEKIRPQSSFLDRHALRPPQGKAQDREKQKERETAMTYFKGAVACFAMTLAGGTAMAETELDAALKNGGERLGSDQIAELLIGHVVTAKSGEKVFRFFYDPNNVVSGELANGGWAGTGAYAITDTDQVCVSMAADNGRYRCLTAVRNGEVVQKFNASGKMTFELFEFEPSAGL